MAAQAGLAGSLQPALDHILKVISTWAPGEVYVITCCLYMYRSIINLEIKNDNNRPARVACQLKDEIFCVVVNVSLNLIVGYLPPN